MNGVELIARERARQVEEEGWTPAHDDEHAGGTLALAAACYATPRRLFKCIDQADGVRFADPWPWDRKWDRRFRFGERRARPGSVPPRPETYTPAERLDLLVKAGALIAAEIDRLQRAHGEVPDLPVSPTTKAKYGPDLGAVLGEWRNELGVTLDQLTERSGVCRNSVFNAVRPRAKQRYNPSLLTVETVAKTLELDLTYVLTRRAS